MDLDEPVILDAAEGGRMEEDSNGGENKGRAEATIFFSVPLRKLRQLRKPQFSPIFYVRDLPWQAKLQRHSSRIPKSLGFYVRCCGVPKCSAWSCLAIAQLCLLKHWSKPSIYSEEAFTREIRHVFRATDNEVGFTMFVPWKDLCDPRRCFLKDGHINVQVLVRADIPHIPINVNPNVEIKVEDGLETTYCFQLPRVSEFRGRYLTHCFSFCNLLWQIMLQTVPLEQPTALGFFLICMGDPKRPTWNCDVEAEFRVVNQEVSVRPFKRTAKHLFCMEKSDCGYHRFTSWSYFLDSKRGLVMNDTACFEIKVRANASLMNELQNHQSIHDSVRREANLCCTVYNISQLKDSLAASTFYVCNLPWRIMLKKRTSVGPTRTIQSYLSVYLHCNYESDSSDWSCNAVAELLLLKRNRNTYGSGFRQVFCKQKCVWGFSHFMPWCHILDRKIGFVKHDSLILRVHLRADVSSEIN